MIELFKFFGKGILFIFELILTYVTCGFISVILPLILLNGRVSYEGNVLNIDATSKGAFLMMVIPYSPFAFPSILFTIAILNYVHNKNNKIKSYANCYAFLFIGMLFSTLLFGVLFSIFKDNLFVVFVFVIMYALMLLGMFLMSRTDEFEFNIVPSKHRGSRIKIDNGEDESS